MQKLSVVSIDVQISKLNNRIQSCLDLAFSIDEQVDDAEDSLWGRREGNGNAHFVEHFDLEVTDVMEGLSRRVSSGDDAVKALEEQLIKVERRLNELFTSLCPTKDDGYVELHDNRGKNFGGGRYDEEDPWRDYRTDEAVEEPETHSESLDDEQNYDICAIPVKPKSKKKAKKNVKRNR